MLNVCVCERERFYTVGERLALALALTGGK